MDFPQPWGLAALPVRGRCEGASSARLSHPPLLFPTWWRWGKVPGAGGPSCLQWVATAAMAKEASGGRAGALMLEGRLCGETITCGLKLARVGHPTSALGWFSRGREKKEILLGCYWFPYLRSCLFLQGLFWGGATTLVLYMGSSQAREVESITVLASVRGDAEGLVHKVALLEGELIDARRAREKAKENVHNLKSPSAERMRWLVASKMER
jgi:hypothetical protein